MWMANLVRVGVSKQPDSLPVKIDEYVRYADAK